VEQDFRQEDFCPPVDGPAGITSGDSRGGILTTRQGFTHQSMFRLQKDV
jgi:hypothetical protein